MDFSEELMTQALINELCSGRRFMEAMEGKRELEAAAIAQQHRGQKGGSFRHIAEIPQREYLLMANKYGVECWDDREFVRDFQRLEPTMASNKI